MNVFLGGVCAFVSIKSAISLCSTRRTNAIHARDSLTSVFLINSLSCISINVFIEESIAGQRAFINAAMYTAVEVFVAVPGLLACRDF